MAVYSCDFLPGRRALAMAALALALVTPMVAQTAGPSFGTVVSLGTTPSDIVLDEPRGRVYLVNSAANRVEIYNYIERRMAGSITVGAFPLSAAMAMDGSTLYVTNTQGSTLSVINLTTDQISNTVSLPARPEGVQTGIDGRVLITTQGTGTNNTLNTLLIYDGSQIQGQQLIAVPTPPPISTPAPLPAVFVGRPATPFPGKLVRTPDGNFIIGMVAINQTTNGASTTLFVYEVASGVVLKNRSVTGQSTVLSISPDGSKFMAGSTLYDTATLAVIGQMNTANLPFFITTTGVNPAFNIQANFGGSVFSSDGGAIYSSFNTSATNQRPVANVLYMTNSSDLGVQLGIKLPQSVLGKMVATSDGGDVFASSESGFIHLPMASLYDNPIIQPETTQVFLAVDECNKAVARANVKVTNAGRGKLTFSVPTVSPALVTQATSGVTPATVEFVMEPGRSGIVRQPGTNLFTGAGTGTPLNVTLASAQAINYANTIRVYMNYRQSDQRGIIYPVPVSLNNAQGLQEILLDERRERVYITNSGYNRIEIFDTRRQRFLNPLPVGQLPRAMALSLDGSTLYVGNSGGESISVVDLDSLTITGSIDFPPVPRAGNQNAIQPIAMAMGLSGLQWIMSNGTLWRLVGNEATPRQTSTITPAQLAGPNQSMIATPGGEYIVALAGNGNAYLYDALVDSYTATRLLYDQPPISYFGTMAAAPTAAYFVVSGMVLNSSLALIGGSERPGQTQITAPGFPGLPPMQTVVSAGQRNVAAAYALDEFRFVRLTTPVRQNATATTRDDARPTLELVDIRTGAESVVGVAPENPVTSVFGTTRANVPSKQMVIDSQGTAYAITLSGLSVIPLAQSGTSNRPAIMNGARGIINSNDGSNNFRPGSFITIVGSNLASQAAAEAVPLPTVLGGTCVVFSDVAIPLLQTSSGQISAQLPAEVRPGQNVVQIRSLSTAQSSDPLVITVQRPQ